MFLVKLKTGKSRLFMLLHLPDSDAHLYGSDHDSSEC